MNKHNLLNKMIRAAQIHQMWPINPQSPLLICRKSERISTLEGVSILSNLQSVNDQSQEYISLKNTLIQPFSKQQKQQGVKMGSRVCQDQRNVQHFLTNVYQKKRIRTVYCQNSQKGQGNGQLESAEIKPVLMIKQIKPRTSIAREQSREQNVAKNNLSQISVRLNHCGLNRNIKTQQFNSNLMTDYNTWKHRLKGNPSRTFNGGIPYVTNKKRSINIKKVALKTDDSINNKIKQRKMISLSYSRPLETPKNVSAKSYIIYRTSANNSNPKIIMSENSKNRQEIASLTKIMTCILILELCKRFSIDKFAEEVTVSSYQSRIGGTSALIKDGQVYTIDQLLYGLMLPSGNDASLALATWAGKKLLEQAAEMMTSKTIKEKVKQNSIQIKVQSLDQRKEKYYKRFIEEMNFKARELKLKKTTYANSHGLSNMQNKSCAYEQALLCEYCMQNQSFRNIVGTRKYSGHIRVIKKDSSVPSSQPVRKFILAEIIQRKNSLNRDKNYNVRNQSLGKKTVKVGWENTHDLLQKYHGEYVGIKTGFTYTAGPCLSSCISHENHQYIVIVLGCESQSMRFRDTETLKKWIYSHQHSIKPRSNRNKSKGGVNTFEKS